jgi:hypothetical protein
MRILFLCFTLLLTTPATAYDKRGEVLDQLHYYRQVFYEVEFWEDPHVLHGLQAKIKKLEREVEILDRDMGRNRCDRILN